MANAYPTGWVTFCDDVRHEVGGKRSLIGIYSNVMYVNASFPVTLPKFAIVVSWLDRIEGAANARKIIVNLPGDKPEEASISVDLPPHDTLQHSLPTKNALGEPASETIMNFELITSPIEIKEPGKIRVAVLVDDKEIELGKLLVTNPTAAQSPEAQPE